MNSESLLMELLESQNSNSIKKEKQREVDQNKIEDFKKYEGRGKIYSDNELNSVNLSFVRDSPLEKFLEAFESIMVILEPIFDRLSLIDKIDKFIDSLADSRRNIKYYF